MASGPTALDRRRYPRRACRLPVVVVASDGSTIPCESMDVSVGGMRVEGVAPIPLGPARVVVDDMLALEGEVLDDVIDVATGTVTTRICFEAVPAAVTAELAELAALPPATARRVRGPRARAVLAAAAVIGAVTVAGLALGSDLSPEALRTEAPERALEATDVAPPATAPAVVAAPAPPTPTTGPEPEAPASAASHPLVPPIVSESPAPSPTPAFVTTTESADNVMTVTVSETPGESSAASTVLPSPDVDRVRVLLHFSPHAAEGGYPVSVTIENRGDTPITFGADGAAARITAMQNGTIVHDVTAVRDDVTEVAPGGTISLDVLIAFAPGTYDLAATSDVTSPQPD